MDIIDISIACALGFELSVHSATRRQQRRSRLMVEPAVVSLANAASE